MVAAAGTGSEVLRLGLLRRDAQLLGPGGQQAGGALGARGAGMDAVYGDAELAQLRGQGLGHVHQRGVARAAAEVAGVAGVESADVDDTAKALRFEQGNGGPGAAERADELDVEVADQLLVNEVLDGAGGRGRAAGQRRAVDQDVQSAQGVGGLVDHAVNLLTIGGVKGHGDGAAAGGLGDLRGGRFEIGHGPRADHHVGALAGQFQGDSLADAAAGAAHKCQFAFKSEIHGE